MPEKRETGLDSHVDRPLFLLLLLLPLLLLLLVFYVPPPTARSFRFVLLQSCSSCSKQTAFLSFSPPRRPSFSSVCTVRWSPIEFFRYSRLRFIYPPTSRDRETWIERSRVERSFVPFANEEGTREMMGVEIEQEEKKRKEKERIVQLTDRTCFNNGVIIYRRSSFFFGRLVSPKEPHVLEGIITLQVVPY